MNIQVTPLAERKLTERLGGRPGLYKLFFDTEGCGCDGINVLLIVDSAGPGDNRIEAGSLPFIISGQQEIFYEDHMRLNGEEHSYAFKLDSDSQIYGTNIKVRDLRGTGVTPVSAGNACGISAH